MKFLHVSDLHLGIKLGNRNIVEDQKHMISEIVRIAIEKSVDGVIIAGDVLDDGTNPTAETEGLLDYLFSALADKELETYVIAGNHDSSSRIEYAKTFFAPRGIHIEGVFRGEAIRFSRHDENVPVDIYLLPFIKPIHARRLYGDESIKTYEDAVRAAISKSEFLEGHKRILVTHQFVTGGGGGPIIRDSEKAYVGGTENVSYAAFEKFDYVALGHIHSHQHIGRETVVYSGTPLKYSSSEAKDEKCAVLVTIDGSGVTTEKVPIRPLRDVRVLRGPLMQILDTNRNADWREDYIYIEMTDDEMDAMAKARQVFPNIINIKHASVASSGAEMIGEEEKDFESPMEALEQFFEMHTGKTLSDNQRRTLEKIIDEKGVIL